METLNNGHPSEICEYGHDFNNAHKCCCCQTNSQTPPELQIWSDFGWGRSDLILYHEEFSTDCTIGVILDFIPLPAACDTHTAVLTIDHETADLHYL